MISKEIQYYNSLSDMNKKIYQSNVRDFYKQLKNENDKLINENYNSTSSEQALRIISNPELLFFIRVIFPCLILYGEFPISLLNKARIGDEEALENIVRTDKSVVFDPIIAKYLHKLSFNKPFHFQQLIKKLTKDQQTLSKSQIKLRLRGLLSRFGKEYEKLGFKPVTSPEIRLRFEAAFPEDILDCKKSPINDESYYKQDSRYRDFWLVFKYSDKK